MPTASSRRDEIVDRRLERAAAEAVSLEGRALGPWRVPRPLGRGGMGSAWLAERADGLFRCQVALKLVHQHLAQGAAERFARERGIPAALEHPNIARLIDAGFADDGRPYLVLECVEREPLIDWCDARRLPLCARIGLARQVTGAVAYAHANLVIHRDLKPSNVPVAADGTVRLLDFGIAKLVGEEAASSSLAEIAGPAITPDCASPEQIAGAGVTTASDVYALGRCSTSCSADAGRTVFPVRRAAPSRRRSSRPTRCGRARPRSTTRSPRGARRPRGGCAARSPAASTRSSARRCARRPRSATRPPTRSTRPRRSSPASRREANPRVNRYRLERARVLVAAGEPAAALGALDGVVAPRFAQRLPLDVTDVRRRIVASDALLALGRTDEAEAQAREALAAVEAAPTRRFHALLEAVAAERLGRARLRGGNAAQAWALLERAVTLRQALDAPASPWLADARLELAACLRALGDVHAAAGVGHEARAAAAAHARLGPHFAVARVVAAAPRTAAR